MASKMLHPTRASKARIEARIEETEMQKPTSKSKRISSIPAPVVSKSSLPVTTSLRSTTRKPVQVSAGVAPPGKTRSISTKLPVKTAEQRMPSFTVPDGTELGLGNSTFITADPTARRQRPRRKNSSENQRIAHARTTVSVPSHDQRDPNAESRESRTNQSPSIATPRALQAPISTTSAVSSSGNAVPIVTAEQVAPQSRLQSFITYGPQPPQPSTTLILRPPAPHFVRSGSASTAMSESPGPFSNFSRGSTPTSMSSASPAMSHIPRFSAATSSSPTIALTPFHGRKLFDSPLAAKSIPTDASSSAKEPLEALSSSVSASNVPDSTVRKQTNDKRKVLRKPPPTPQRVSSKAALPNISINTTLKQDSRSESKPKSADSHSATSPPSASTIKLPTPTSRPAVPPSRPSRDGIPTLGDFTRQRTLTSPVASSTLNDGLEDTTIPSASARETQEEKPVKTSAKSFRSTSKALQSSKPKSVSEPKQTRASSPHLVPRETSKQREPSLARFVGASRQSSRELSPSITSTSKSTSRFSLFTRKLKSPSETSLAPATEKAIRPGPAAGTGHEGYGRYGRRGRSSSTGTVASRARSASIESTSAGITQTSGSRKSSFNTNDKRPQLDDFLRDRLEPVIIGGGGKIRENRNSSVGISQPASTQSSTFSLNSVAQVQPIYRQGNTSTSTAASVAADSSVSISNSLTSYLSASTKPTLAHRRSLLRAQSSGSDGESILKLPPPINTQYEPLSPGPATYDSILSTTAPTDASEPLSDFSEGHEGNWLRPKGKTLLKSKKSRKWNIFHRGQRSNDSLYSQTSNEPPALGIFGLKTPRSLPHYALPDDFETERTEPMEVALRNIEAGLENDEDDYDATEADALYIREPSVLLPSPPSFPSQFDTFSPVEAQEATMKDFSSIALGRHPRLQHVGRIPQVTSRRERMHKPSPQSFSRPFVRPSDGSKDKIEVETASTAVTAPTSRPKLGLQTQLLAGTMLPPYGMPKGGPSTNAMLYNLDGEQEFLRFSPRKWSEISSATSAGSMSLAAITATISPPDAVLTDDEIWGEFDDFLDQVASPASISPDTPDISDPGNHSRIPDESTQPAIRTSLSTSTTTIDSSGSTDEETISSKFSPKQGFLAAPALQAELNSPISLTDLYTNYGARATTGRPDQRDSNLSMISGSRYSSQTQVSSSESRTSTASAPLKGMSQIATSRARNTSSESLRFSALMTSRWLSFDRVLFSPIQERLRSTRQDRILVVDGLGNDDWSTYCALTFPDITVHSLSSGSSRGQKNPEDWQPPTNHRRHTYTDVTAPFPFVKNWFSAVVFRFPTANTSMAYKHTISECKRVLRPGGFLELSVLDMDMVNMGSKTSHAIRDLKTHMHSVRPDISLNPVSDEVLKLLGRKGFENVSRAVVGVPVVESAAASPIKSVTSESQRPSLGYLLANQVQSQELHYPSTRAMAKAARWWWSKCYENSSLGKDTSIWDDRAVLQECETRETGLKLFVCYAQKPVSPPRRTMSV